jgi:hypothetical protein
MTELEQLLIAALTKQHEHVDALIEQVGDLVSEQATMAEQLMRLREQLRPYGSTEAPNAGRRTDSAAMDAAERFKPGFRACVTGGGRGHVRQWGLQASW